MVIAVAAMPPQIIWPSSPKFQKRTRKPAADSPTQIRRHRLQQDRGEVLGIGQVLHHELVEEIAGIDHHRPNLDPAGQSDRCRRRDGRRLGHRRVQARGRGGLAQPRRGPSRRRALVCGSESGWSPVPYARLACAGAGDLRRSPGPLAAAGDPQRDAGRGTRAEALRPSRRPAGGGPLCRCDRGRRQSAQRYPPAHGPLPLRPCVQGRRTST